MATYKKVDQTGETRSRFNEQVRDLVARIQQDVSRTIPTASVPQTRASREAATTPSSQEQVGRAVNPSGPPARTIRPMGEAAAGVGGLASRGGAQPSQLTRAMYVEPTEAKMVDAFGNGRTKVWDTDWVTLFGAPGATGVTVTPCFMPQADYLDAGQYTNLTLRLSVPGITNAQLKLEHSSALGGPFANVFVDEETPGVAGTTTAMLLLSSEGGDRVFTRYVRWALYDASTGAPGQWRACFRIEAFV